MRDVIDRIRELIRKEELKNEDFAAEIGETPRRLKSILAEQQRIPGDVLRRIIEEFNINANWLLLGEGNMRRGDAAVSQYEAKILEKIRATDPKVQEAVEVLINNLPVAKKENKKDKGEKGK